MSTTTEILPLEGIDLSGTPSCTFLRPYPRRCGEPSVVRVVTTCVSCRLRVVSFACTTCKGIAVSGGSVCGICLVNSGGSKIMQAKYQGET